MDRTKKYTELPMVAALVILGLLSCRPVGPEEPTVSPVVTEETPVVEATSVPTVVAAPTTLPTSPATPTEAPLSQTGPWVVFEAADGLWAINPDGTGLTHVYDGGLVHTWPSIIEPSPVGGHVAFITSSDPEGIRGLELSLLSLPGGQVETLAPLAGVSTEGSGSPQEFFSWDAVTDGNSLAWSPDGRQLAFIAAYEGPSADLYVYDLDDQLVTQLTSGPTEAFWPRWSSDGSTIFHAGLNAGPADYFTPLDVWAAAVDGSGVDLVYRAPQPPPDAGSRFLGWREDGGFWVASWGVCGCSNLRAVTSAGVEHVRWPGDFDASDLALTPGGDFLTYIFEDYPGLPTECAARMEAGLYLMQAESAAPEYLGDIDKEGHLAWSEAAQGYTVLTETAWLMVSPIGEISELQSPPDIYQRPSVSPDGQMWAWWVAEDPSVPGVWVGPAGEPARQVFDLEASEVAWSPDSQGLYIFSGYPTWDLLMASAPDFEPHRLPQAFDRPYAGSGLAFVQP